VGVTMIIEPETIVKTTSRLKFPKFLRKYFESANDEDLNTVQTVYAASVILTDAQIKALPTTPHIIKEATESPEFEGVVSELFHPVGVNVYLDNRSGAYTNVAAGLQLIVGFGSGWTAEWGKVLKAGPFENAGYWLIQFVPGMFVPATQDEDGTGTHSHLLYTTDINLDDGLDDNALFVAINNSSNGDLTGGNAGNRMKVEVLYRSIETTLT
jgi:hypothetical protein